MSQSGGPRLRLEFWRGFRQSMADRERHHLRTRVVRDLDAPRRAPQLRPALLDDPHAGRGDRVAVRAGRPHREDGLRPPRRPPAGGRRGVRAAARLARGERAHARDRGAAAGRPRRRDDWPELFAWLADNLDGLAEALGPFVGRSIPVPHQGDWDEHSFFAALAKHNPAAAGPARRLLEWGRSSLPHLYWGHGKQVGSFMPGILRSGIEHSVVSVWTDGLFCLRFQALGKTPAFAAEAKRAELLDRLNEVPRFDLPAGVLDKYPGLPLRLLDDPASMRAFLSALDWCVAEIKRG